MRPIGKKGAMWAWTDRFLAYMQHFDVGGEDSTQMQILRQAKRSNGEHLGEVIPLNQIRVFAHLIPRFRMDADPRLTAFNSLEYSTEFYLNKYFDKNTYIALSPLP